MDGGVGATLREARNRRKLDLSEVEQAIKIRARLLRAMENEEWDALPSGSYARSFVRTYGNFLGLDGERLAEDRGRESHGAVREGPRVDPDPVRPSAFGRRPRLPGWASALAVCALLVAVLVVVGLSGGGGSGPSTTVSSKGAGAKHRGSKQGPARAESKGLRLRLAAEAEVWACVLGEEGRPLVDGEILEAGAEAGPFRSNSFTVAFGNGSVAMTIDGKRVPIPASASPVGYSIDAHGRLSELAEGERPTCT